MITHPSRTIERMKASQGERGSITNIMEKSRCHQEVTISRWNSHGNCACLTRDLANMLPPILKRRQQALCVDAAHEVNDIEATVLLVAALDWTLP